MRAEKAFLTTLMCRMLDVSTQGRAVFLNENDTLGKAFSFVTPLSIPYLLDGLVPQLSAAVDGDPATAAA